MKKRLKNKWAYRWTYALFLCLVLISSGSCGNDKGEKVENKVETTKSDQKTAENEVNDLASAWKDGWNSERVLAISKGERPDPSVYLEMKYIKAHLDLFDDGAVRFCSRKAIKSYGTLGPDGGFIMSKDDFDEVIEQMHGNLRGIEKKLGLDPNYLDGDDVLIAFIENPEKFGLRMPSGNEGGANEHWLPGGVTSGGINEAVMDFSGKPPYQEIELE